MHQRYKDNEISQKEYYDWLAQSKGYKNYTEYIKQYRQTYKEQIAKYQKQWRINHPEYQHKEEIVKYKKQWNRDNKEDVIEKKKQYYENNKKEILEKSKQYRQLHREQIAEWQKQYRQDNKEQIGENKKQWYASHPEWQKQYRKQHYQDNKDDILGKCKQYRQTPNGKLANKRKNNKRKRELGYNILNEADSINPEYVGHHMNQEYVLFVPKWLNEMIPHSVSTNKNMDKINSIAIDWYNNQ